MFSIRCDRSPLKLGPPHPATALITVLGYWIRYSCATWTKHSRHFHHRIDIFIPQSPKLDVAIIPDLCFFFFYKTKILCAETSPVVCAPASTKQHSAELRNPAFKVQAGVSLAAAFRRQPSQTVTAAM